MEISLILTRLTSFINANKNTKAIVPQHNTPNEKTEPAAPQNNLKGKKDFKELENDQVIDLDEVLKTLVRTQLFEKIPVNRIRHKFNSESGAREEIKKSLIFEQMLQQIFATFNSGPQLRQVKKKTASDKEFTLYLANVFANNKDLYFRNKLVEDKLYMKNVDELLNEKSNLLKLGSGEKFFEVENNLGPRYIQIAKLFWNRIDEDNKKINPDSEEGDRSVFMKARNLNNGDYKKILGLDDIHSMVGKLEGKNDKNSINRDHVKVAIISHYLNKVSLKAREYVNNPENSDKFFIFKHPNGYLIKNFINFGALLFIVKLDLSNRSLDHFLGVDEYGLFFGNFLRIFLFLTIVFLSSYTLYKDCIASMLSEWRRVRERRRMMTSEWISLSVSE